MRPPRPQCAPFMRPTPPLLLLLACALAAVIMSSAPAAASSLALVSTTAPPFSVCTHPDAPSRFFAEHMRQHRPMPTNRWWMNSVLGTGDNPIVTYPYSLRMSSPGSPLHAEATATQATGDTLASRAALTQAGVYMSLPVKEVSDIQVIMPWRPELLLTTPRFDVAGGSNASVSLSESAVQAESHAIQMEAHQVVEEDLLSVRMQWKQANGDGRMMFPLVRGSPYITGFFSKLCPALYTGHAILSVNDDQVPGVERQQGQEGAPCVANIRHHIVLNSGTTVLVYLDRPACATWDRNRVSFHDPNARSCKNTDWVMRVAMLPALSLEVLRQRVGILDAFRASIALSASVSFSRAGDGRDHGAANEDASSTMRFAWRRVDISHQDLKMDSTGKLVVKTREVPLEDQGLLPCELLLLALPHQKAIFTNLRTVDLAYDSLKGPLTAAVGDEWLLHLRHATTGNFFSTTSPLKQAKQEWQTAVKDALIADAAQNITEKAGDPYGAGKGFARIARLILIADEIGGDDMAELARSLRQQLQADLEPWLEGTNADPLMFDTTWGGIVPSHGMKDFNADFGAGKYNDHHFHYGYFIYAFATIVKEDRAWGHRYREQMLSFVRDIANPSAVLHEDRGQGLEPLTSSGSEQDKYFPAFRHTDVWDGHSWANGLFASPNGRNSESSSEAINAYYSIALLGRALDDAHLTYLGEILSSIELHGVKHYWHMTTEHSAYDQRFAKNKCVGMLWSDKAIQETWFAVGIAYVHAINILPITPISEKILTKNWVQEEYPVLEASLPHSRPLMDDPWLGFVHADLAVLNPEEAWRRMHTMTRFDNGASLTNFLYWIATRPAA